MDTPFHYGILPMLDTAFQMFEENSKGKCRTELVLQSMQDGDLIVVFGREAARDIERRLVAMGKGQCIVIPAGREDIEHPPHFYQKIGRRFHSGYRAAGRKLHLDHTFVHAWIEASLVRLNHDFEGLVGMVGSLNDERMLPAPTAPVFGGMLGK